MIDEIRETAITLISEGCHIQGKITLDQIARVHGSIEGEIHATPGSSIILGETAWIKGNVHADMLWVDGFVEGEIHAKTRVVITATGRVVGNIHTPSLQIDFGAYFEGEAKMDPPLSIPIKTAPTLSAE